MLIFENDERLEIKPGERAILQRRIKNQRKELRRLNAKLRSLDILVRNAYMMEDKARSNAYRHAAQMAEKFPWLSGYRIGEAIRRWL